MTLIVCFFCVLPICIYKQKKIKTEVKTTAFTHFCFSLYNHECTCIQPQGSRYSVSLSEPSPGTKSWDRSTLSYFGAAYIALFFFWYASTCSSSSNPGFAYKSFDDKKACVKENGCLIQDAKQCTDFNLGFHDYILLF